MEYKDKDIEKVGRLHKKVTDYLAKVNRSFDEEASLVSQKKSALSRAERDYVVLAAHVASLQSKELEVETADVKAALDTKKDE